jgi:kynurenine formamidase
MASETLSNWGRWGPNDERGTLNLVTAKNVKDSVSLVRHGKVYSLSVELDKNGPLPDIRNPLWHRTSLIERPSPMHSAADDVIVMHTHGTTHIDALCHIFAENQMYNGYRVDESIHPTTGASKNGVQNIVSIVGRGVLLDIAGYRGVDHLESSDEIPPAELDACAQAQGVEIKAGDIVLIRTGWMNVFFDDPVKFRSSSPGVSRSVAGWFKEHHISALGADNMSVEPYPQPPGESRTLHYSVIRDLGGYLMEFLHLEELAADKVYEFMFVAAPLRLINGIGSPINPLAIC